MFDPLIAKLYVYSPHFNGLVTLQSVDAYIKGNKSIIRIFGEEQSHIFAGTALIMGIDIPVVQFKSTERINIKQFKDGKEIWICNFDLDKMHKYITDNDHAYYSPNFIHQRTT